MKLLDYFLILMVVVWTILLYLVKVDWLTITILILVLVIFRLFRTKIYEKIEKRVRSRIRITSTYPEWVVKLFIVIFFVMVLILLKWIVFEIFKLFGIDIRQTLTGDINRFIK